MNCNKHLKNFKYISHKQHPFKKSFCTKLFKRKYSINERFSQTMKKLNINPINTFSKD